MYSLKMKSLVRDKITELFPKAQDIMWVGFPETSEYSQYLTKELLNRMLVAMSARGHDLGTLIVTRAAINDIQNWKDPESLVAEILEDNPWKIGVQVMPGLPESVVVGQDRTDPNIMVIGLINRKNLGLD